MTHTFYKKIFFSTLLFLFFWVITPSHAFAARVYVETDTNPMNAGGTAIISVKIDSENQTINVVKGQIDLGPDMSLFKAGGMSIAGSVLTIWPQEPMFSKDGRTISFEGGVPRGFIATGATLFTITLSAERPGRVDIDPDKLESYLNDGKGTLASTTDTGLALTIREATSGASLKNIIIMLAVILLVGGVFFMVRRSKK